MPDKNDATELHYRAASLRLSGPKTLDRENRSLEFVISTEDPVLMYDWETGEYVPEVLLAKGASMPKQVPLLDTHDRYSVKTVLGSVRNKKVEDGLVAGTAIFSKVPAAEEALIKYEEGHLTDFSAGYRNNDITRVKKGEKVEIDGRTWKGPVNVVTSWTIKEASCCPIGADPKAKARAADKETTYQIEDNNMPDNERFDKLEESLGQLVTVVGGLAESVKTITATRTQEIDQEKAIEELRQNKIRQGQLTVEKERARITAIEAITEKLSVSTNLDFDDIRVELIQEGVDELTAYKRCMDRVAAMKPSDMTSGIRISVGKEDKEKSRGAAVDGLLIRSGIKLDAVQDHQTEYQTMTLLELAKNRCLVHGQSVRGLDQMQIFERAMSSSDFDNILADVANKALLEGFERAEETYETWVDTTGRTNDFKTHVFARASEAPSFQEINPDGGEYRYGKMSDTKESVAVVDYGIIVPFTRKAMVNDDLGALSDIRTKLGESARRKYGALCYAVLTGNPTMGDSVALFDASTHANYVASGSGAAPSVVTLNTAATAMATQTDLEDEETLNIRPQFILAPWALKGTIDQILVNTQPVALGAAATPVTNPWSYLQPIYEARLDANLASGWYLAARKGKTVKLFTLNGNLTPSLAMKFDWSTDSLDFKSRICAAAKAMDYRGLYYNYGA